MKRDHPKYKHYLILLTVLVLLSNLSGLVFYSNPDDISSYVTTGMYPENKYIKKVPLNTNWEFRLQGDDEWKDIYIPSAYDNYDQDKKIFFRTNFFIGGKKSSDRNYKLVFYGVNYKCNVKVNDKFIENHSSPTSFEVNLNNNQLNFGETNTLLLEVNNKLSKNTIPSEMQVDGWRNYGGIIRDVYLIITSQTTVTNADIKYYFSPGFAKASAEVTVNIRDNNFIRVNETDSVIYENNIYSYFEITDNSNTKPLYTSEKKQVLIKRYSNEMIKFNFEIDSPKLWSPGEPNLYSCSVFLGKKNEDGKDVDFNRFDLNFGFKELRISDNKFILNGERFYIKGVSRYEDIKDMGSAITYSKMKTEIEKIKNMGVNLLYCNAYAPHPYIIDLCDKYGIFVLEELPVNSAPAVSLRDKDFIGQSYDILEETISRDKMHVSLFGLGLGFGYNVYDLQTVDFIKDLSDKAKEFDDEILTFITSEFTEYDEYYKLTDFNIITLTNNLSESEYRKMVNYIGQKGENKPVIINNRLIRVYPDNQNGYSDPHSEPAQAKRLLEAFYIVREDENISGMIIDSFRDHRTDVPLLTNRPDDDLHIIRNGLIDYEGNERISFRVLDGLFKERKTPALAQGEYSQPDINIYFITGLFLTLFFFYMIKREHYLLINSIRSIKNPDAFFIDIRDKRITQVLQALFIGVISSYGISAVFSTIFYSFRQNDKFDYLLTWFIRTDMLKKYITFSSWEPIIFLISGTLVILLFMILLAVFLKAVSVFFNMRYSLSIAFSMVMWNSIVFLPLIPLSAVFLRLFSPLTVKIILFIFFVMCLWFFIRFFLIMAVSFKTTVRKIIWINLLIFISAAALWVYFFGLNLNRISYFLYLIDVLVK